jgi:hypothetical protein
MTTCERAGSSPTTTKPRAERQATMTEQPVDDDHDIATFSSVARIHRHATSEHAGVGVVSGR